MTNPFGTPAGPSIRIDPAAILRLVRVARNVFIPAILLLLVIPWLGRFAVDWLWAREVGYEQVYLTSFGWRAGLLFVPGGIAEASGVDDGPTQMEAAIVKGKPPFGYAQDRLGDTTHPFNT